jgi:hypothetical protein
VVWGGSYQYRCTDTLCTAVYNLGRNSLSSFVRLARDCCCCKSKRYTQEEGGAHVAPICALEVGYTESTTVEINAHVFNLIYFIFIYMCATVSYLFQLLEAFE